MQGFVRLSHTLVYDRTKSIRTRLTGLLLAGLQQEQRYATSFLDVRANDIATTLHVFAMLRSPGDLV